MALATHTQLAPSLSSLMGALINPISDKTVTWYTTNSESLWGMSPRANTVTTDADSTTSVPTSGVEGTSQPTSVPPVRSTEPAGTITRSSYQPTATTSTGDSTLVPRLEKAAQADNVAGFMTTYRAADWSAQPATLLVKAIRLALNTGVTVAARELASLGLKRYPDDPELQRLSSIFMSQSPARRLPPEPASAANMHWLHEHRGQYSGQWVALRDGVFLASADTLADLISIVGNVQGTGIFVGMMM